MQQLARAICPAAWVYAQTRPACKEQMHAEWQQVEYQQDKDTDSVFRHARVLQRHIESHVCATFDHDG